MDGFPGEEPDPATSDGGNSKSENWGKRDESAGTPYGFSARVFGKYASNKTHDLLVPRECSISHTNHHIDIQTDFDFNSLECLFSLLQHLRFLVNRQPIIT